MIKFLIMGLSMVVLLGCDMHPAPTTSTPLQTSADSNLVIEEFCYQGMTYIYVKGGRGIAPKYDVYGHLIHCPQ